jgi:hypothetical protein
MLATTLIKPRAIRRAGAVICTVGRFIPTYSKEGITLKT